jgi:nitrilase
VQPVFGDRPASLERAAAVVAEAGDVGARFVAFPEAFLPGFPYWINFIPPLDQAAAYRSLLTESVELDDPEHALRTVCAAARAHGVTVALGLQERAGSTIYNAVAFIDATGAVMGVRRKLIPTLAERMVWGYGDASTLHGWPMDPTRVSGMMCWEHTMNLARQALAEDGVGLHAAPWPGLAATRGIPARFHETVRLLSAGHALTTQCFVVAAMNPLREEGIGRLGPKGTDGLEPTEAWSAIIGPDGTTRTEHTGSDHDHVLVADLNLGEIVRVKQLVDAAGHSNRPKLLRLEVDRTAYSPRVQRIATQPASLRSAAPPSSKRSGSQT